ncbi:MAG: hypothetical protein AAGC55_27725, partial [Myxococcota bacterium]
GVKMLVLFHHDPKRSDDQVAAIEDRARAQFTATVAARENMSIQVGAECGHSAERRADRPGMVTADRVIIDPDTIARAA